MRTSLPPLQRKHLGDLFHQSMRLTLKIASPPSVRPAPESFYQALSDEEKARFNAVAPTGDADLSLAVMAARI